MRKPDEKLKKSPDARTTTLTVKFSKNDLKRLDAEVKKYNDMTRSGLIRHALAKLYRPYDSD